MKNMKVPARWFHCLQNFSGLPYYISVKIGIKEEAKNIGGISIFGKSFGDYPQDIVMKLEYDKIKE